MKGIMPEWQVGINSHKYREHLHVKENPLPAAGEKKIYVKNNSMTNKIAYFNRCF